MRKLKAVLSLKQKIAKETSRGRIIKVTRRELVELERKYRIDDAFLLLRGGLHFACTLYSIIENKTTDKIMESTNRRSCQECIVLTSVQWQRSWLYRDGCTERWGIAVLPVLAWSWFVSLCPCILFKFYSSYFHEYFLIYLKILILPPPPSRDFGVWV